SLQEVPRDPLHRPEAVRGDELGSGADPEGRDGRARQVPEGRRVHDRLRRGVRELARGVPAGAPEGACRRRRGLERVRLRREEEPLPDDDRQLAELDGADGRRLRGREGFGREDPRVGHGQEHDVRQLARPEGRRSLRSVAAGRRDPLDAPLEGEAQGGAGVGAAGSDPGPALPAPDPTPATTRMTETTPVLLRLSGVWKRFPGVVALRDVSFAAAAGEVHALLGENGAGKSTLMGIASGSIVPDSGTIEIAGEQVESPTPELARGLGLAIVHQQPALLPDLTVRENVLLAIPKERRSGNGGASSWVRGQLERVGCTVDPNARMQDLSIAQRQLVERAKALALEPKVLVLDEPTAPLGAERVERVFAQVREAAA